MTFCEKIAYGTTRPTQTSISTTIFTRTKCFIDTNDVNDHDLTKDLASWLNRIAYDSRFNSSASEEWPHKGVYFRIAAINVGQNGGVNV